MDFLKKDISLTNYEQFEQFLKTFLDEGQKFNGTNIFLSNVKINKLYFAHNYRRRAL